MTKCKYPDCQTMVEPPNIFCSWMCEVDAQNPHPLARPKPKPVSEKRGPPPGRD